MVAYVADQSWKHEQQRLGGLERSFDPASQAYIRRLGLARGWRCLEVGAGSGSMARWLADQVGHTGYVLAVDIETGLLDALASPHLEVRRLDVGREPLPEGEFDLVHARLVLGHLAERERELALTSMIKALKPGGVLLVEDADFLWTD